MLVEVETDIRPTVVFRTGLWWSAWSSIEYDLWVGAICRALDGLKLEGFELAYRLEKGEKLWSSSERVVRILKALAQNRYDCRFQVIGGHDPLPPAPIFVELTLPHKKKGRLSKPQGSRGVAMLYPLTPEEYFLWQVENPPKALGET